MTFVHPRCSRSRRCPSVLQPHIHHKASVFGKTTPDLIISRCGSFTKKQRCDDVALDCNASGYEIDATFFTFHTCVASMAAVVYRKCKFSFALSPDYTSDLTGETHGGRHPSTWVVNYSLKFYNRRRLLEHQMSILLNSHEIFIYQLRLGILFAV